MAFVEVLERNGEAHFLEEEFITGGHLLVACGAVDLDVDEGEFVEGGR